MYKKEEWERDIRQAKELKTKINDCIKLFTKNKRDFLDNVKESEIKLRFNTVENMLLLLSNECHGMVKEWEDEYKHRQKQNLI